MIEQDLNPQQEQESKTVLDRNPNDRDLDAPPAKPKRRFPIQRTLIALLVLGAIGAGGFYVFQTYISPPIRETRTVAVKRVSIPITVPANGTVQPEMSINVSPKNSGRLKSLLVKEGDRVTQGQILAYMDDSNLQGQLLQAQGQLTAAEATAQKLRAGNREQDIAQAQASVTLAQADLRQAELTFQQNQALYNSGAISQRDFENSRATRDANRAKLAQAQQALSLQQVGSRPEDITQAEAQAIAAQGSLLTIQSQIEDTIIRAPFNGVVARKYADPGAFVSPATSGSSVSSATSSSILSLASNNQVVANVAETNIALIKIGQEVTIQADAYPGQTFKGKVTQISPQSTVTQNVTSFEVKAAIVSENKQQLRSGMNVNMEFKVGKLDNVLVVPTVAIVRKVEKGVSVTGVYVKNESGASVFTPIVIGITSNDKTEVKSGLTGNENILISFPEGMRPQTNIPVGVPGMQPSRGR
ncbi:efflux RND transporter periplasmic adaptor subunit [Tumidithrix helvetica PCC 7403]|uniref:efflux RND transporter periplasmic adaptor subunit n=1 Tax=Tumidithrix helvetica TaxID=3457545 RepID=UPI003CB3175F